MFYTPAPIVDYMVSTTLSRLLADRTPEELTGLQVLDPSCGCGAFLIGCFRFLIRWREQRLGDLGMARQHAFDLMGRAFRGCDIDPRALQWTAKLLALAAWHSARGNVECSGDAWIEAIPDFKPTPLDDHVDLYFLLGVLNSKVFSRYMALTMPRISAGRFSLRLSAMRRFPAPAGPTGSSEGAVRQIASLARKLVGVSAGRAGSDLCNTIDAEVAQLYISVR